MAFYLDCELEFPRAGVLTSGYKTWFLKIRSNVFCLLKRDPKGIVSTHKSKFLTIELYFNDI